MKALLGKTIGAAILATGLIGAAAYAKPAGTGPNPPPACVTSGDLIGVTVFDCTGFTAGNLINSAASSAASGMLASIGVTSDGHASSLASVSGSTLTFTDLLVGTTVIGLHIGGGSDGHVQESTAFYVFDAGLGTHTVDTRFTSLSNGGLYATAPVPEPATYGMLLAGLGMLVALRRKAG